MNDILAFSLRSDVRTAHYSSEAVKLTLDVGLCDQISNVTYHPQYIETVYWRRAGCATQVERVQYSEAPRYVCHLP
jgi:hypothetical protein